MRGVLPISAPTVSQGGRRRRSGSQGFNGQLDRLPAPTRERRPALAALAVLLIVGGALLSALIVLRSGHRSDYLVMTKDVSAGQQITEDDFGTASLAGSGLAAIPALNRPNFVGSYAATRLFQGQLPTGKMFSPKPLAAAGSALVGVVLADGSRPSIPLEVGDVVGLFLVPVQGQAAAATTATELIHAVRVVNVAQATSGLSGSAGQYVTLLVPDAKAAEVTFAAVNKQLSVVLLPRDTPPTIDFAPPAPLSATATPDASGAVTPPAGVTATPTVPAGAVTTTAAPAASTPAAPTTSSQPPVTKPPTSKPPAAKVTSAAPKQPPAKK
jgi:hypothetical protein